MNILNKIDSLRLAKGWSIYKLAEESGVNQSTLANMFARNTLPSITTLSQLCEAFNVTLSQFFAEIDIDIENESNKELIKKFNLLNKKEKFAIMQLIETLIGK